MSGCHLVYLLVVLDTLTLEAQFRNAQISIQWTLEAFAVTRAFLVADELIPTQHVQIVTRRLFFELAYVTLGLNTRAKFISLSASSHIDHTSRCSLLRNGLVEQVTFNLGVLIIEKAH